MSLQADLKLRPDLSTDPKWSTVDLRNLFDYEGLANMWNDLVRTGELVSTNHSTLMTGKLLALQSNRIIEFQNVPDASTIGHSPSVDSQVTAGKENTLGSRAGRRKSKTFHDDGPTSSEIIESWTWRNRPTREQLAECLKLIIDEQNRSCCDASGTTLYSYRFRQRATVLKRYFVAHCRLSCQSTFSKPRDDDDFLEEAENENQAKEIALKTRVSPHQATAQGLARLGSRTALSFAFAFLRRAWRSGEDADLCTELLKETHDALITLPEASLFDESQVSSVWLEVVERTTKFLRSVVMGDVLSHGMFTQAVTTSATGDNIPPQDRYFALNLLLEFAIQKGTLHEMLDMVRLLLSIWNLGRQKQDNRSGYTGPNVDSSAPLINFLKRFCSIEPLASKNTDDNEEETDLNDEDDCFENASPTEAFLTYLQYPENDDCNIDLQQSAVVIMSHIDQLASVHMPASVSMASFESLPMGGCGGRGRLNRQQIIWSGNQLMTALNRFADKTLCDEGNFAFGCPFAGLQIVQMAPTVRGLCGIDKNGRLFYLDHDGSADVKSPKFARFEVNYAQLAVSADGRSLVGVDTKGTTLVYWEFDHEFVNFETPFDVVRLRQSYNIIKIAAGSGHFMFLTAEGEVYSWSSSHDHSGGLSRMGTQFEDTLSTPVIVSSLKSVRITDIACGGSVILGDAFNLALSDSGTVFSWGNMESKNLFGAAPGKRVIDKLQGLNVEKIFCGGHFWLALCRNGAVYTWGKGAEGRLGHGSNDDVRHPKIVETLLGKKVAHIAVGISSVLVITEDHQIIAWGSNEKGQFGENLPQVLDQPVTVGILDFEVSGISMISGQTVAWSPFSASGEATSSDDSVTVIPKKIPFVLDVCEETFRCIDQLLEEVCDGLDGRREWPPPKQEQECIAVSCLNLLKLQLHAILVHKDLNKSALCLQGTSLLASLKNKLVDLASNNNVIESIQSAAQSCLLVGWMIVLPTAEERAKALSTLLPNSSDASGVVPQGKMFMTDLLVSSLMADGGLEAALLAAIKIEVQELEETRFEKDKPVEVSLDLLVEEDDNAEDSHMTEQAQMEAESKRAQECSSRESGHKSSAIPLLLLVKQLLKSTVLQTSSSLRDLTMERSSANLNLLLRFQRLLFVQLFKEVPEFRWSQSGENGCSDDDDDYKEGKLSLLRKYISLLSNHIVEVLPLAISAGTESASNFVKACEILEKDVMGLLIPEFVMSLSLLQQEEPSLLSDIQINAFTVWLQSLDQLNKLAPGLTREDNDDMAWPGSAKYLR